MSFTQDLFSSRRNHADGNVRIGEQDRLWYDSITNTLRIGDGSTAGGIIVSGGGNITITGGNYSNANVASYLTVNPPAGLYSNANVASYLTTANINLGNLVINDQTIAGTNVNGNITISPNGGGNIMVSSSVVPTIHNTFTLGTPTERWEAVYVGPGSIYLQDTITNDTVELTATSGVLYVNGVSGLTNGNLYFYNNSIRTLTPTMDITFGETVVGQGNLIVNRDTIFNGNVTAFNITALEQLMVTGTSSLIGNVVISGTTQTLGTAIVQGAFTANGTSSLIGNVVISGLMTHVGDTIFIGNVTHTGNLQIDGLTTVSGNLVAGHFIGDGAQLTNVVRSIHVGDGFANSGVYTGNVSLDTTDVHSLTSDSYSLIVNNDGDNYITLHLAQELGANSSPSFQNLTVGNLSVTGVSTIFQSASVNGKVLYLANNSTSNTQISGGGIVLGNTAQSYFRSILYDLSNDRWDTDVSALKTAALTTTNGKFIGNVYVDGTGHFGSEAGAMQYPNAGIQVHRNVNNYQQIISQNLNSGTGASTDFVATNDIGDDTTNYIDMGINSSTYNVDGWAISGPNDGYLYVAGNANLGFTNGSLTIGTTSPSTMISFHTSGTDSSNIRAVIDDSGLTLTNTNLVVQDGNQNILLQLVNDAGVGKIRFGGGSQGIWYNGGVIVNGIGYHASSSAIQTLSYNTATGEVSYGQTDYSQILNAYGNTNVASYLTINPQAGLYSNANVANYLPTYSGNVNAAYYFGNGSKLTGIGSYGNANVASYLTMYSGNVNAASYFGNGSHLTGVGTVTSITASSTQVNGLSLSGGTITGSGSIAITGTLSNITNGQLTNSTISGVSLGGNLANLTAGTGITFSSGNIYNGSTAITINAASGGVGGNQLVYVLNAPLSLTSLKNTLQSLFGLTNGVSVASNTRYQYELVLNLQSNKAGALGYALTLGGGAVIAQHNYTAQGNKTTTVDGYTAGVTMMSYNATGANITTATLIADTTNGFGHYIVNGTIDVTTGGNVNFMINQDQNTPITWSVLSGAYIKLMPVGVIGANTAAGTWS